jgi:hypothetical protein
VGDDPIFVGADGLAYEVRGEAHLAFNLLTSPRLSINAEFREVPRRFRAEDITDTVIGSVSIAACSVGGGTLRLGIDVDSGNLTYGVEPPRDAPAAAEAARGDDGGAPVFRPGNLAARVAAAAAGVKLTEERFVCNVARAAIAHACYWQARVHRAPTRDHSDHLATPATRCWQDVHELPTPPELPLVASPYSRLHVRTPTAQLAVTRNAMVDLGDGDDRLTIDCGLFRGWPDALAACTRVARGQAPADREREWTLMFATPFVRGERYFHFAQLDVLRLDHAQAPAASRLSHVSCGALVTPSDPARRWRCTGWSASARSTRPHRQRGALRQAPRAMRRTTLNTKGTTPRGGGVAAAPPTPARPPPMPRRLGACPCTLRGVRERVRLRAGTTNTSSPRCTHTVAFGTRGLRVHDLSLIWSARGTGRGTGGRPECRRSGGDAPDRGQESAASMGD